MRIAQAVKENSKVCSMIFCLCYTQSGYLGDLCESSAIFAIRLLTVKGEEVAEKLFRCCQL